MKIVALIDLEAVPEDDPELEGHGSFVLETMEYHVVEELRLMGHEVLIIPFLQDFKQTIDALSNAAPDLVFNMTERIQGDRRKDVHVTALLELLGLPYTGAGPTGLTICRDKAVCKRILSHHRIRFPRFVTLFPGRYKVRLKNFYPAIVKPLYSDGSDGISLSSLVANEQELEDRVRLIHSQMKQPVICEEFIDGREVYVGILGNERLSALPSREIRFGRLEDGGPTFATSRVKWDDSYREKWKINYVHADLPVDMEKRVRKVSKQIYRLLHLRDYGRIDLRLTETGEVVFLEANPNPNLAYGEDVAEAAEMAGITYRQVIERIVRMAVRRGNV